MAADSGARPDPYVLNSRANALGSLGRWEGAPRDGQTLRHWIVCLPLAADSTEFGAHNAALQQSIVLVLFLADSMRRYMLSAEARRDYLQARDSFQSAKGLRGRQGGTTQRLDGAPLQHPTRAQFLAMKWM